MQLYCSSVLMHLFCWCSRCPQEAAKGTTKRISLAGISGVSAAPLDVEIPAGVDSGQTIQVRRPVGRSCSAQHAQRAQQLTWWSHGFFWICGVWHRGYSRPCEPEPARVGRPLVC